MPAVIVFEGIAILIDICVEAVNIHDIVSMHITAGYSLSYVDLLTVTINSYMYTPIQYMYIYLSIAQLSVNYVAKNQAMFVNSN